MGEDWRYELLLHLDLGLLELIDLLSNHLHLLELTGYWMRKLARFEDDSVSSDETRAARSPVHMSIGRKLNDYGVLPFRRWLERIMDKWRYGRRWRWGRRHDQEI
jgi:hypothetical protein